MQPKAVPVGFDLEKLKEGIRRLLPVLRTISAITPTPVDNLVVSFLEALLRDETKLAAAAHVAA